MSESSRTTEKLYYRDLYAQCCHATIVDISENAFELDRTVAYPEGGGQESDSGWLETPFGTLPFCAANLIHGTPIVLEGFQGGKSGGIIVHRTAESDLGLLEKLTPGMSVQLHIHVERRQWLSLSHSASHFLYAAVLNVYPQLKDQTIGCHIKERAARFDFFTEQAFQPHDVEHIEKYANDLIAKNRTIQITSHAQNQDARTWIYEGIEIPCGGTHLSLPENIGKIKVARKKLGKNKERLSCTFDEARIDCSEYHPYKY